MDISRSQMDLKKDTIIKSAQAMQLPQKMSDKTWKLELFSFLPFLGWNQYGVFQVKICNQYCELRAAFQPQDVQVLFILLFEINYIPQNSS